MNTEKSIMELTKSIGIAALVVGTSIVGMKYINNYIYNSAVKDYIKSDGSKNTELKSKYKDCFTIDRIIDADCNGHSLVIGVNSNVNHNNILSHQGIRYGKNGEIKRLTSFIRADNGLIYGFEDSHKLTLTKDNETKKIRYSYESPEQTVVKEMDEYVVKIFKTISFHSKELDSINELK
jgi:hypothetical protein